MSFDSLIYNILLVLYGSLRGGCGLPSDFLRIEKLKELKPARDIPPRYWDAAIRTIAVRGYATGFDCDYETNRIYIGDASKLEITFDGYEFMKQERFPDPDEELEAFKEEMNID